MKRYVTTCGWVDVLRRAAREQSGLVPLATFSRLTGIEGFTLRKALLRAQRKGLVRRVGPGLYINELASVTLEEIAMALGAPCYVSFESALAHHGVISQEPLLLTCATTLKPGRRRTPIGEIVFRHIIPRRFFGYVESAGILRAEPEKALLDWLYWSGKVQGGRQDLDELEWEALNREKLLAYAEKFPAVVRKALARAMRMKQPPVTASFGKKARRSCHAIRRARRSRPTLNS